jgi:MFS family permease
MQDVQAGKVGWGALLSGKNGLRSIALAGGVMLHAMDVYLATTIMPSVTSEIGGLSFYAWATTMYVVAAIIGSVISSLHLSRRGPRSAYRIAAILFAAGSVISASAPSMMVLLIGRFVQGLGGGLLFALSYSMIRIVFEEALWPRAMALVSGMFGISAFSGPFVGGMFAQYGHWRFAFITLVAITILLLILTERVLPKQGPPASGSIKLPVIQLVLLAVATLAISIGSVTETITANVTGVIIAVILFGVLLRVENKTTNRLLPQGAYKISSPLGATYLIIVMLTFATAVEIYIPYFMQVIHGFSPVKSGYLTVLISLGWTFGSITFSGFSKAKGNLFIVLSPVGVLVGLVGLAFTIPALESTSGIHFWMMCLSLVTVGVGVGMGWPHLLTRVLTSAPEGESERASASITTVQLLAAAFGTALTGLVVNAAGIIDPGGLAGAEQAATWLFGIFLLMPVIAILIQAWGKFHRTGVDKPVLKANN